MKIVRAARSPVGGDSGLARGARPRLSAASAIPERAAT